jgi:hypothetical protein
VDWEAQEGASFYFFALYDAAGVGWSLLHGAQLPPTLELPVIGELPGWPARHPVSRRCGASPLGILLTPCCRASSSWFNA